MLGTFILLAIVGMILIGVRHCEQTTAPALPFAKCEEVSEGFYRAEIYEDSFEMISVAFGWGFSEQAALAEVWDRYAHQKELLKRADEWDKRKPKPTYHTMPAERGEHQ